MVEPALGVDMETRTVRFERREPVPFDVLSVGAGSVPNRAGIDASDDAWVPIKPMQTFLPRLYDACRRSCGKVRRSYGSWSWRRR